MAKKSLDRLIYIDDSGHPQAGTIVYGWIEFQPDKWADILGQWLAHRKRLWVQYSIPVPKELHMTEYVAGRGRVSKNPPELFVNKNGVTMWKDLGRVVAEESLATMSSIEGLRVGAVYREMGAGVNWSEAQASLYQDLIYHFEGELSGTRSMAMVFMDGDGSDSIYRDAHRNLPRKSRRIIEDPIYTDSKSSQLMQMADHVAWCAHAAISQIPHHEFSHNWYADYFSVRDLNRSPIELPSTNS